MEKSMVLEACNIVSEAYGARQIGLVDGYKRQRLVSIAYTVDATDKKPGLRLGFAQSSLLRAPDGGFPIWVKSDILDVCQTAQDIVDYVTNVLFGNRQDKGNRYAEWLKTIMARQKAKAR